MADLAQQNKFPARFNNRWLLLGSLMLFALVLNREGDRMPTGNEFVYLLYFFKAWHPSFLANDWTFQEPTAGHAIFSDALGWMTWLMPLTAAAWIGRIICWFATFLGLFRLGRHFKIDPWAVWVGILLWLLQKQSPVTGEWMVGTFEAKVIAYPCLLFAIDAALSQRFLLGGILCGIAFSFHSAVGMWGGAALGFMVLTNSPIRKTIIFSLATIVFSLPGLITSWSLIMGPHAISFAEAQYLTTIALPDCFDPKGFGLTWIAVLLALPTFSISYALWLKTDREVRQLVIFESALAIFFAFGLLARVLGRFDWIELYPMRVYAVFALLLFFWRGMSIVIRISTADQFPKRLAVYALLLFFCLPSPILQLRDMVGSHLSRFLTQTAETANTSARGEDTDFILAAQWINDEHHTRPTDLVIAPPWWNDGFYYIRRPLIANWHAPRYDRLTEWKDRIESLVGDTSHQTIEDALGGEMDATAWQYYQSLTPGMIDQIRGKYPSETRERAKWLITTGRYNYPVVFSAGSYFVYKLP